MKVLLINTVCGIGSTGRICTDLYDELIEQGHKCCIAYGRGEAPSQYDTYKIGGDFNNYLHVIETRLFDNHGFSSRISTKKFISFIKDYNPDVINIHNIHGYFLNLEILCDYLSKTKAKIIWTLHDGWLFSGHSAHPKLDEQGVPIFDSKSKKERNEYPKSYISREKRNYNRKRDAILKIPYINFITPSLWLKEVAKETFLKRYEFTVINNGIDLSKFYPEYKNNDSEKKIILGVASFWNESKGLGIFNELAENLDINKYQIVLVGDIKNKINSTIKHVYKTESIDELRRLYSKATYFVNPTFKDNFPTVNIEALACGTPVISFKTGGSPEMLTKKTGIVLEQKDAASLCTLIMSNPSFQSNDCVQQAKKYEKKEKTKEYLKVFS